MRSGRLIPLLLIAALTTAISPRPVHAAPAPAPAPAAQPGTRVGIANPSRIFAEMHETKALRDGLEARRKELAAKELEKRQEIEKLIQDRDSYLPTNHKYTEACEAIDNAKAQFQAWGVATKASVDRQQKVMVKTLYEKIEAAVAQVAQQDGIDLVIADGRQEITNLEDVPAEELRRILNTRAVLYSTKAVDISERVIVVLDQQFAKSGGTAVPPPIPAPAPK